MVDIFFLLQLQCLLTLLQHFQTLSKTKEVTKVLNQLGFTDDLTRTSQRTIRAGKAKRRGRKYQTKKGALLVVGDEQCKLIKGAQNIPGVEIVPVHSLHTKHLAPGCHPGRLTLFTKNAIEKIEKEKLFM